MPLDVRVAGALILLFGVRLAQVLRLTTNDILHQGDGVALSLDRTPVLLPPRLADLVIRLSQAPDNPSPVARSLDQTSFLFPGLAPGRPIGASPFGARLDRHGVGDVLAARNTALLSLAEDLPAPVITELFGLSLSTTTRWAAYAKRDWTSYLAARASDLERADHERPT